MDFQIRECEITDTLAIHDLNAQELGYDYPEDKTKEKITKILDVNKDKIYVAVIKGNVVGYVHATDYDVIYAPHMKNIMGIAVKSSYRKMGIGKALLTSIEQWAINTGTYGVRLVSGSSRMNAHEFYRHCGYSGDKQQVNFKKMFYHN
ncbi:MAG: GNAT family N-acetyltransferase [Erysipelotrichaceae bacterium]|nr:GNAT family N-acetyltransferase [Erysipelotrichaceae bacterium]